MALPLAQTDLFGDPAGKATQLDRFLAERDVEFVKNGKLYKQFHYGAFTVDLFLPASPDHWGSVFFIRTGSHEWNMWVMQTAAPAVGVKFSKGRVYQHGALLKTPEEPDVLDALHLPWVPPHHRDDNCWLDYVPAGHPAGRVTA